MTQFTVDSEALNSTASVARATISRIQSDVAILNSQVASLEGAWTGQAASAFQSAALQWKSEQQRVEENLAALNQTLGVAGQQYAEIEAANARLFGR